MKSRQAKRQEVESQQQTASSGSTMRRMRLLKSQQFDKLVTDRSLPSIGSRSLQQLSKSAAKLGLPRQMASTGGLDLYEDFVSDASDDAKNRMKKATYEMD